MPLTNQVILITGAGGSIGSELCRQVARLSSVAIVLLERSEFNLYSIEMELREQHPGLVVHACLGDVCEAMSCPAGACVGSTALGTVFQV